MSACSLLSKLGKKLSCRSSTLLGRLNSRHSERGSGRSGHLGYHESGMVLPYTQHTQSHRRTNCQGVRPGRQPAPPSRAMAVLGPLGGWCSTSHTRLVFPSLYLGRTLGSMEKDLLSRNLPWAPSHTWLKSRLPLGDKLPRTNPSDRPRVPGVLLFLPSSCAPVIDNSVGFKIC